ncbi:sugar ABC transporter permease [Faecalicatena orotica]|uniref:Multiple sugar transport system permease protein/raffinose/stachyose/melibiose transport system permease protein n=1 Tax=Faecalicatena orotica TaxID=1544 RepID=A0A2Y9BKZ3_9FIRM|nr:sugar ABC transporter permease [Faecalicatena orotica]PWJ19062.1 multiple sugar transport system permease protein/raffinose/stachyose/melibiose transport system permease protein [Faecalicatena orotica]SSA58705.1 multiple sugar transport system permease protein/raffinose/stachyose/melibiose transport system permease protein [Faecalicatena orotica]
MKSFYSKRAKLVFILPGFILFTVFVIYSIVPCFIMSLQNHNGAASLGWVGIENYVTTLKSPAFWAAHKNTYWLLALELLVGIPGSLLLALMLDRAGKAAKAIYRFAALFPIVLSVAVVGKFFVLGIFDTNVGLLNSILNSVGLENLTRSWLSDSKTVMTCIAIAYIWQYLGMNSLLFYTGIRTIPGEFYEAALIDGAGFLKASIHITIPLLQDVLKYVLIGATIGTLGMYSQIAIMTRGGPGRASRTVIYEMFYQAFKTNRFGYGCAIALLFLLECIFWAFIINKFVAREPIEY